MGGVVLLIVVLVVVVGVIGAAFLNVLRAEPNSGPALGNNNPYPDGVGAFGPGEEFPPYMPTPVISDAELFRREAHLHLDRGRHGSKRPARSWMEEPGAKERAGLVDRDEPAGAESAHAANEGETPDAG